MSEVRHTARARVELLVEVEVGSVWGADCPISQVYRQAAVDAQEIIGRSVGEGTPLRIIGQPRVAVVIVEETRP